MKAAFDKLLNRKKKPKILNTGPGLNQSMIDIIINQNEVEVGVDHSFHSHRIQASSPSIPGDEVYGYPDQLDFMIDSPDKPYRKANITTVMNVPKKHSLINELYELTQEQVIEQLGERFFNKRKSILQPPVIQRVHLSDFADYISKLKKVHGVYKKQNNVRARKRRERQETDIIGSLNKCYSTVPNLYFDDDFLFNFEYLTSQKDRIMKIQEDLGGYLDIVEFNLHLQLTNRFQEFLDIILKLSQMEAQIQNSLHSTKFFRSMNRDLQVKCSEQVQHVLKLKRRKTNFEKVFELANVMNIMRKAIPTLADLVEKNDFKSAIELIKNSEETYQKKLSHLKVFKNSNLGFKGAKSVLENLVAGKFEDKSLGYLAPALSYTKKSQNSHLPDMSLVEESFMNVSTIDGSCTFDDEPSPHLSLNWALDPYKLDEQVELYLANTILEYTKIKPFPLNKFREKISNLIKRFNKQFMDDMDEYISGTTLNRTGSHGHDNILFDLHIKFVLFYFQLLKRFVQRYFVLGITILSQLIAHYNQNYTEHEGNNNLRLITEDSYQSLRGTVDEVYSGIALVFKIFNDRMSEIITKQSVENISTHQFSKLNSIFSEITSFYNEELNVSQKLGSWLNTDMHKIKQPLAKLAEGYSERITIAPILNLKTQLGKDYISFFHKHNLETIKHSLEQDTWVVSDIPYTYKSFFEILLNVNHDLNKTDQADKPEGDDDIFKSARPDVNDLEIVKKLALGDAFSQRENLLTIDPGHENDKNDKEVFEIKKNELIVHNKKFKVTTSFLLLIKILCDYYNVSLKIPQLREPALTKLFSFIRYYNSYSRELIYEAKATNFNKVKKITAKILGLSVISLDLLKTILTSLTQTIKATITDIKTEWLEAESNATEKDIQSHIDEIKAKVRSILKIRLEEQCEDLGRLNWGDVQGKINIPTKSSASILHNTRQMYKTIEDVLFREQLVDLFRLVFEDIIHDYIPIFEKMNVESKLAAKRIKEELDYFRDDLHQIQVFQDPDIHFEEFKEKLDHILETKCNPFLEAEPKVNPEVVDS